MPRTAPFFHVLLLLLLTAAESAAVQGGAEGTAFLLRADGWFDSETGRVVPGEDVLVRGRRIIAVGPDLDVTDDVEVVELPGYTLLPGLIDLHTHLFYAEDPRLGLTAQSLVIRNTTNRYERMLEGVERAREYLCAGFTSVRDLGNSERYMDVGLRNGVGRLREAPSVYPSGPGVASYGAQFAGLTAEAQDLAAAEYDIVDGPRQARRIVREHVHHGAMVLKVYANNSPNPRAGLYPAELEALVEAARFAYLPVTAHATFDGAVRRALDAGIRMIEHGYGTTDSTLSVMAEVGAILVPTLQDSSTMHAAMRAGGSVDPDALRDRLGEQRDLIRRARAAGVTLAFGSDAYVELGFSRGELARRSMYAWTEAGIGPAEVLRAATSVAAEVLRNTGIGEIRPGARADVIAVAGDPTRDLRSLEHIGLVMRDGRRVCRGPPP